MDSGSGSDLMRYSPWIKTPEIDWSVLIEGQSPRRLDRGYILYMENETPDFVYLIREGRASLSILNDDRGERIAFIADAGMIIGKLSAFDFLPNFCCAKIISDAASVYFIPKKIFLNRIQNNIRLWQNVALIMSKTVRLLLLELRLMTFDDSDTRVCYALMHMIQEYSTRTSEGEKIIISFTHEQIGELTGLSRVSVSNILSRFIKEGVLQKRQGHYYVKNPAIIYQKICPKTGKL